MGRYSVRTLGVMALLFATGCYSYAPLERSAPRPGEDVRAQLNEPGMEWIDELTGNETSEIEGRLVRAMPDTLVLAVWRSDLPNQIRFEAARDTLRLPGEFITALEQKRLSYIKTGAVVGAAVVGLYFLVEGLAPGSSGGTDDGGGPMLLSIPLEIP